MADSLITDEMTAELGKESEPRPLEVDRSGVRMWARAIGYTDPIFYDVEKAKAAGYRDLPAPPGFLGTGIFDPSQSQGPPTAMPGPQPSRPLNKILNGGTEIEILGDICAGDTLYSSGMTAEYKEREGSLGAMLFTTNKTIYRNESGETVAVMTGTVIRY